MMTLDEAVLHARRDPALASLMRDSYMDEDAPAAARRFAASAEFAEIAGLAGRSLRGLRVVDLGAGTGIASFAFASAGALVTSLEPDESDLVGLGALRRLTTGLSVTPVKAPGETIPLGDETFDLVYARQVLHHLRDLKKTIGECFRVLKKGGVFLACREPVVDDAKQLEQFLAAHPIHQLAGGEGAWSLPEYETAILQSGLQDLVSMGPWDSLINAFPAASSPAELSAYPATLLKRKFGALGAVAAFFPGVKSLVWKRLKRPVPGRMYTFLARKR